MTLSKKVFVDSVKAEAGRYFETVGDGPHSGYKGYRRWLYNATKSMDEDGYVYTHRQITAETRAFNSIDNKRKITNENGNWSALGPFNFTRTSSWAPGQGRVTAIAVEPVNQELIFVGSPGGGIWRSDNSGTSWVALGDQLDDMSIWAIAIDPNNSSHVLHLNGSSDLMESFNKGESWTKIRSIGFYTGTTRMIKFHPTNSDVYFVSEGGGLFKTTDGGANFDEVINSRIEDVFFKPGDINTMYACGNDFWKSTDLGENWIKITNGISVSERMKMTVTPANNNVVYIVQKSGSGFGRIYKSTDSGNSFTVKSDINSGAPNYLGQQASRDMAIMCSEVDDQEIHIAGLNNYRSQNGGETFVSIANWNAPNDPSYIHADVEVMININGTLYAGTDGGIFRSPEGGNNYTDLTQGGLAISQFYRMGGSAPYPGTGAGNDPNQIICGAQDNGTLMAKGENHDWIGWLGADGMECIIDYSNDNIIYGTTQNGGLNKSTNRGDNINGNINKPVANNYKGEWVTPFEMDPKVPTTLYVGYDEVYMSTNSGNTWSAITSGLINDGRNFDEIAIAPSNTDYIYIAEGNRLWVSTNAQDAGRTWTQVSGITGNINYITVDPNNPEHVIITTQGTRVFESNNAGTSWTNIAANLPSIGALCALIDNSVDNGIYIGMASGVYYKDDTQTDWVKYGAGIPNCEVNELEINYQSNMLRCATYGRGVWEIGVFGSTLVPVVTIETTDAKCEGDTIILSVTPDPNWVAPVTYQWYKNGEIIFGATSTSYNATEEAGYFVRVEDQDASGVSLNTLVDFVDPPASPSVTAQQLCGPGTVTLMANGSGNGEIKWYDDLETINEVGTGNSYTTIITDSKTFYVKEQSQVSGSNVGRVDNQDGSTGRIHQGGFGLIIDVDNPFKLISVKVYAEGTADRTFELRDAGDNVIKTKTVNVPDGESRITLDMDIPRGLNLKIMVVESETTGGAKLYRNDGNIGYPFRVDNVVTIKGSTATTSSLQYYYYLYDWEILPNVPVCFSLSSEAQTVVLTQATSPDVTDQIVCETGEILLTASTTENGTVRWYNSMNPEVVVNTGTTFNVDVQNTTTFLVDVEPEAVVQKTGLILDDNQGRIHAGNYGLQFDVLKPMTLISAEVKAEGAGERTIQVFDNNGLEIVTKVVNLQDGVQRVPLNISFEVGNNYKIGVSSGADLFRTDNVNSYPINLNNVLNIKGAYDYGNQSQFDGYYYYLYDWEVVEPLDICVSDKAELTVTVDHCTGLSNYEHEGLKAYPNPTGGILNIELPEEFKFVSMEVTDLNGNTQLAWGEFSSQIDLQGFSHGAYFLKVVGDQGIKTFKVIIE